MAVRLKDIARELNVSAITVSKALRGNTDISEATRQRVLALIKELDYQPNMMARSLATGYSFIIGLVVPDLVNPFFAELSKSLGVALRKHAYGLIVSSSEDDPEIERSEIRMMLARGVDALLLASCQSDLQGLYSIHNRSTPFVLLDRPFAHLRMNFVGTDDLEGGRLATEHLIQSGRKRLAYIGSPDASPAADRFRGFHDALREHDIVLRNDFVLFNHLGTMGADKAGYETMQRLLKSRQRPDAVFCHNDVVAIGAMKATLDAGLSIPKDIAFVGYDNVSYSRYLQIPLTSVDQSLGQMGEAAAQLALDLVAKKIVNPQTILLKPNLVVRQSTTGDVVSECSASQGTDAAGETAVPNTRKRQARRRAAI